MREVDEKQEIKLLWPKMATLSLKSNNAAFIII